jgi:hypothetical protein
MFILIAIFILAFMRRSFSRNIPTVSFPFKNTRDENNNLLPIIMISAPFRSKEDEDKYIEYRLQGLQFCGISSYLDFPNPIDNPYEDLYHVEKGHFYPDMVKAWLHCFRKPGYTQSFRHLPHLLLTEADLTSAKTVSPVEKTYDFLYCCLEDNETCDPGWQSYNRNWDLAKRCLEVMCRDFNLRGILIGRQNCEFTDQCNGIVSVKPFLPRF